METLVLPGFSASNKDWVDAVKANLTVSSTAIYWPHWPGSQPEPGWVGKEALKISDKYLGQKINIIAKSIGTLAAMAILKLGSPEVNKLILCGIPLGDLHPGDEQYYTELTTLPAENILVIQNDNDNHGSYEGAKTLIQNINSDIQVVSKPAADHNYPYFSDFNKFLKI